MRRIAADKKVMVQRFSRSLDSYESMAVVQAEMAAQLVEDLVSSSGTNCFDRVLELGCGTGLLSRRLVKECRVQDLVLNDLVPDCRQTADRLQAHTSGVSVRFLQGDMEAVELPDALDLVISSSALHWAGDLRSLVKRLVGQLRPGGTLAMASFGPSNLREVAELTNVSLPYWSVAEWGAALAGTCEVLDGSEVVRTLWFPSAREVVRHLKETGVNALDSRPWSRSKILEFCRNYEERFRVDGKVPLTYHPVFVVARRRDALGAL